MLPDPRLVPAIVDRVTFNAHILETGTDSYRPHTPTDQAWIETFFGHIKHEWPHLLDISEPDLLSAELDRVRVDYNTVRLHEAIGYVTPDDEHHGRGEAIREAGRQGLARARQQRLDHNRRHPTNPPEETP